MRYLADTHLLVWWATEPTRLSAKARTFFENPETAILFSVVSIWEATIRFMLGRPDFPMPPRTLRDGLLARGFEELSLASMHAYSLQDLPPIHRDPFDRILIAQAQAEGLTLLTADKMIARYPGPILKV